MSLYRKKGRVRRVRRNPSARVTEVAGFYQTVMKKPELAEALLYYADHGSQQIKDSIEEFCELVYQVAIAEDEDEDEESSSGELTDKQAWKELAVLVKKVGKENNWPEKLIEALHDAFMEESKKAS